MLSAVGQVSFIAKSEVRDWPVFGMFAVLQRTVFVERARRQNRAPDLEIANRLIAGDAMVLLPKAPHRTATGCCRSRLRFRRCPCRHP